MDDRSPIPKQPAPGRLLRAVRREENAVVLELEDGEELAVAPDAVPSDLPPAGAVLPGAMLAELRRAAERKRAARRLLALLDRRLAPVARLRRKLVDEGLDPAAVDAVLAQMATRGLYSDRRYADAWCRDTLRARAVGRRYLEARLRDKGVPAAVAREAAAAALAPADEEDLARRAATRRWARVTGPPDRRREAQVVRHLQGRGFPTGLAVAAARAARPRDGREGEETT